MEQRPPVSASVKLREMWRDLQGEDYELETPETGGE